MRIALFLLLLMFVSGTAYTDMNSVREFKKRTHVEYNGNPFGLVYAEAITENASGKVNIHPITYVINSITMSANVCIPADYDPAKNILRLQLQIQTAE